MSSVVTTLRVSRDLVQRTKDDLVTVVNFTMLTIVKKFRRESGWRGTRRRERDE